jgi:mono/diheme cytochrome c family protein
MRAGQTSRQGKTLTKVQGVGLLALVLLVSSCSESEPEGPAFAALPAVPSQAELDKQADVRWALLQQYCSDCHNLDDFSGGLAFDLLSHDTIAEDAEVWEEVVRKLRGSMMPPPGQERPAEEDVAALIAWLEGNLDQQQSTLNPGEKLLHRMNRTEYANAIRDLLQLDIDAAALLPVDGAEDGFDNIATALQVTPSFVDQYLDAARVVSERALGSPSAGASGTPYSFASTGQSFHVDGLPLGSRGGAVVEHYFPSDGEYRLNIGSMASGLAPGGFDHASTLVATIDGKKFFETTLGGLDQAKELDQLRAPAVDAINARLRDIPFTTTAGPHQLAVFFLHRSFAESDAPLQQQTPRKGQDALLRLGGFEVYGPVQATGLSATPSREKIFSCYPGQDAVESACAEQIVSRLAHEAFRGALDPADTALLMQMYESGTANGGFEKGIGFALSGILAHPKFLFRVEPVPEALPPGTAYELSSVELASRLSFFLWSSVPDAPLLELAAADSLKDPAVLEAQVLRMLQDPRARNLADNFAFQWLGLGELENVTPDAQLFRDVDRNIRSDLTQETLHFVHSIFDADRSVVDLLTADHSYLNENLALHYGINEVRGSSFRRVELADERRWGLLGKGAVLMVSSYPNRTSPVLRGKWLLEKIMGTPPAAPPPEVEGFEEIEVGQEFTTVRERLETHRSNPSCNGCHGVIDPLGFALENFDAVGRWQDLDRMARTAIDASGVMADGTAVDGPVALRAAILKRPQQFVQTFTEKLMTFALGRGVEYHDMPTVRRIVREAAQDNYRFSTLVTLIVQSEQFRMRSTAVSAVAAASLAAAGSGKYASSAHAGFGSALHHE